jgi:hypothetical protein
MSNEGNHLTISIKSNKISKTLPKIWKIPSTNHLHLVLKDTTNKWQKIKKFLLDY